MSLVIRNQSISGSTTYTCMIYVIYLLFFFLLLLYLLPPYLSVGIGIGIGIGITNIDITDTSIDITNINRSMLIDIGIDIGSSNIWYLYFTYLLPKYYLLFFTFFFCFLLYKLPGPPPAYSQPVELLPRPVQRRNTVQVHQAGHHLHARTGQGRRALHAPLVRI